MFWFDLVFGLILVLQVAAASFTAWLHWAFVQDIKPTKDINALVLVNLYLVLAILTNLYLVVSVGLLFATGLHVSVSSAILLVEMCFATASLVIVLSISMLVLKTRLTVSFDQAHGQDQEKLAKFVLMASVGIVMPPAAAVTGRLAKASIALKKQSNKYSFFCSQSGF